MTLSRTRAAFAAKNEKEPPGIDPVTGKKASESYHQSS
jgi:hypothetical protein